MCGGGSTTSTSSQNPNPLVAQNYQYITDRATRVADIPYQYYPGQTVAPTTGQSQSGYDMINAASGVAQPYIDEASQYARRGAAPISRDAIQGYMNPYQDEVIDATMANMREMEGSQRQGLIGNAISKGAWGGDRAGVALAEQSRQQGLAAGQTLAGLHSQNYGQALTAAQQDSQRQAQAGYTMGALGQEAQSTALTGANAQIGAGQLQQQQSQNEINSAYTQWQQARGYPAATTNWLAGIMAGQPNLGGTSTTTSPSAGIAQQAIGAGAGIAGILGATGAFGSSGWMWSDERLKENVEPIGLAFDGQMIYRYNFKGDPKTQIGFLAQEVERHNPGAVGQTIDGIKGVDYHDATDDAAERGGFGSGGIPSLRSPLIPSVDSYTPEANSPELGPLVGGGYELKSITKPAYDQATRGGFAGGGMPSGIMSPYPDLGAINGVPIPAAMFPPEALRTASARRGGGDGLPAVPKGGAGGSDIGGDVIRLAQMLRSFGLGKSAGAGGGGGSYDSVGSLIQSRGLTKRGGRQKLADGGEPDDGEVPGYMRVGDRLLPSVTLKMPLPASPPPVSRETLGVVPPDEPPVILPGIPSAGVRAGLDYLRQDAGVAPPPAPAEPSGVAPPPAPMVVAAAPPPSGGGFYDRWSAGESTNNPQATNPSGAAGLYQFMPQTWAAARAAIPGLPDSPLKATPAQQRAAAEWYRGQAASVLARSLGRAPTEGELGLSTLAGPAGASALLRLDPATPLTSIPQDFWQRMGEKFTHQTFLQQNPGIARLGTVGGVVDFFKQRFEGGAPSGVAVAGGPRGGGVADDGGDGDGAGVQGAGIPDDSGQGSPTGVVGAGIPGDTAAPKPKGDDDASDRFMNSPWMALANMGFGMAASKSPTLLGALGEGGLHGVQTAMAQGKTKREIALAKANEAYRNAHLGIQRQQADRQMTVAEETARRNAATEAARTRSIDEQTRMHGQTEADRNERANREERRIAETERRNQEREMLARAAADKPKMQKETDPYTGKNLWQNGHGDLFILGDDGKYVPYTGVQSGARSTGYKDDPAKERTVPLASGDATIPPLDPRDLQLGRETLKKADLRADEIRKAGSGAGDVQRQLDEMKKAFASLPTTGAMAPGALAETWRRVARSANALSDTLGVPPVFNPEKVGSLDEMKKLTIQLAATATKAFNGSRPTNFDFEQMLQGTPGAQLGPDAFNKVVGFMEAQNQRARDLAKYTTEYQRHRRTAYGVDDAFNAQRPDDFYTRKAGIGVVPQAGPGQPPAAGAPPRVATEAEYNAVPRGSTYIDARDGKTKTKR